MPQTYVTATVSNKYPENNLSIEVFADKTSVTSPTNKKLGPITIAKNESKALQFLVEGTDPGDYKVSVIANKIETNGANCGSAAKSLPLTIRSNGIQIVTAPAQVAKGQNGSFTVKIYGHKDEKYTIQIDNSVKGEATLTTDPQTINYTWNTSDSEVGAHTFELSVGDLKEFKNVNVLPEGSGGSNGSSGGTDTLSTSFLSKTLTDFLRGNTDSLSGVTAIIALVINYTLDIAGVVAFIMILYASIIYLTSYGEESKAELGKKTLIWSIIGIIIVSAGKIILNIVTNVIK